MCLRHMILRFGRAGKVTAENSDEPCPSRDEALKSVEKRDESHRQVGYTHRRTRGRVDNPLTPRMDMSIGTTTLPKVSLIRRARRAAVVLGLSLSVGACASDAPSAPVAPEPQASNGLLGSTLGLVNGLLSNVTALLRLTPLNATITRSVTVNNATGGVLLVPETGLEVIIPAGALPTSQMTITVKALAGRAVAYDFEPHGTQFVKPLQFRQSLGLTLYTLLPIKPTLTGGYFANTSQVNTTTGSATLNEVINATVVGGTVYFNINHFSGYMVSTGRSSEQFDEF